MGILLLLELVKSLILLRMVRLEVLKQIHELLSRDRCIATMTTALLMHGVLN